MDNNDSWSFEFSISRHSGTPHISKITPNDTLRYTFIFFVELKEKDTTKYDRMNFRVDNIKYRYSSEAEPLALNKFIEYYNRDEHNGATSVNHGSGYGPLLVSMPLPDTIWIEQDVTVFYQDSGKEVASFHHVVIAELAEGKYSHLRDFIDGP